MLQKLQKRRGLDSNVTTHAAPDPQPKESRFIDAVVAKKAINQLKKFKQKKSPFFMVIGFPLPQ